MKELIELSQILHDQVIELVGTREFKDLAKPAARKSAFGIINIATELKHELVMGLDPNSEEAIAAFDFLMVNHKKLFDAKNKARRTIFKKPTEKERPTGQMSRQVTQISHFLPSGGLDIHRGKDKVQMRVTHK